MFIDTQERPAGEVQQKVGRIKLSEAIRESAWKFVDAKYRICWQACAIGAAHYSLTGRFLSNEEIERRGYLCGEIAEMWAREFGYDPVISRQVQVEFDHRDLSHYEIADWLEAQGL